MDVKREGSKKTFLILTTEDSKIYLSAAVLQLHQDGKNGRDGKHEQVNR